MRESIQFHEMYVRRESHGKLIPVNDFSTSFSTNTQSTRLIFSFRHLSLLKWKEAKEAKEGLFLASRDNTLVHVNV